MSVYVDPLFQTTRPGRGSWPYSQSCHLYADTSEELHEFAARLQLQKAWFQDKPRFPHYDLTAGKRERAIRLGAVEHTRPEFLAWFRQSLESGTRAGCAS